MWRSERWRSILDHHLITDLDGGGGFALLVAAQLVERLVEVLLPRAYLDAVVTKHPFLFVALVEVQFDSRSTDGNPEVPSHAFAEDLEDAFFRNAPRLVGVGVGVAHFTICHREMSHMGQVAIGETT